MIEKIRRHGSAIACTCLALLVGLCVGIVANGFRPVSVDAKGVYARFLAKDPSNYSLDGRLDLKISLTSDGTGIGSAIPVTVSVGFSDTVVDHSVKGMTSMRLSLLDLSDGYDLESYADYDSEGNAFLTYSHVRSDEEGWGTWSVQDGYMLALDSRALFRGAYLLEDDVTAEDGVYRLAVRPNEVWAAIGLDEMIRTVTGAEALDRNGYASGVARSTAFYEVSADTGYLLAVDVDGFAMEVDGNQVRASMRIEFSGYGGGSAADVAVPVSVTASAVHTDGISAPLLRLPGGDVETVTGTAVEDVDENSWSDQFAGDYGFDVVKYEDGTWHVLDMDGNEVEGSEVYDDGSVYHPDYGRIYPDYETDNG